MREPRQAEAVGNLFQQRGRARAVCRGSEPGRRGFSLVELLVVIAILAVLAALLLPTLARSGANGREAQCLSNLRQMGIAAHAYTGDNSDSYPIAQYIDNAGGSDFSWDLTVLFGGGGAPRVVPGILWKGQGNPRIQQCPAMPPGSDSATVPFTGYNYNTSYIGHGQGEAVEKPACVSAVGRPSKTVVFGDGQYSGGADRYMRAPWPNPADATFTGRWSGTQGFRHEGRSNAAFCDGHTEAWRVVCTNNADGGVNVAPGTGFLSPDNSVYDLN